MAISESRPWKSDAIGVHPDQVDEMNESCHQRSVNGYYDEEGTFHAHSRQARNQELEHRGFRDNDAGYGDYAGR